MKELSHVTNLAWTCHAGDSAGNLDLRCWPVGNEGTEVPVLICECKLLYRVAEVG